MCDQEETTHSGVRVDDQDMIAPFDVTQLHGLHYLGASEMKNTKVQFPWEFSSDHISDKCAQQWV